MKPREFKTLIKEAVREAIQEELKDILLEAVRGNRNTISEVQYRAPISQHQPTPPNLAPAHHPRSTNVEIPSRLAATPLQEMLAQTRASMNSSEYKTILDIDSGNAPGMSSVDLMNGKLPEGEVSMNTIMKLVGRK